MRLNALRPLLLPLAATVVLAACHGKDDPSRPGGSTPQAAVQTSVDLFKAGKFNMLWKHALPPADYATLKADWAQHMQDRAPITAADRVRFTQGMQQLTAPDAETKLYSQLQPKLANMESQYKDQLPVLISVGEALVKRGIAQNHDLTDEQKNQTDSALDVITPWAQKAPWFDQGKAKQAIHVAVTTARQLDLKSPDQLRGMGFDTAMDKYSIGFGGIKQLLAIYGLSIDDALNSVKLSTVSSKGDHAVVKIDYTLLGKPLSTETKLVRQDGRWYSQDMLDNVRASHRQLAEKALVSAPAASHPAMPTTTAIASHAASATGKPD